VLAIAGSLAAKTRVEASKGTFPTNTPLFVGLLAAIIGHPGDGEVVEGIATVDESAITGESAPVIRESGGDRSAVTGGTRVLSDRIVVRITAPRRARRSSTA
jgi:K+-transporting ATPase ATPase B chain